MCTLFLGDLKATEKMHAQRNAPKKIGNNNLTLHARADLEKFK